MNNAFPTLILGAGPAAIQWLRISKPRPTRASACTIAQARRTTPEGASRAHAQPASGRRRQGAADPARCAGGSRQLLRRSVADRRRLAAADPRRARRSLLRGAAAGAVGHLTPPAFVDPAFPVHRLRPDGAKPAAGGWPIPRRDHQSVQLLRRHQISGCGAATAPIPRPSNSGSISQPKARRQTAPNSTGSARCWRVTLSTPGAATACWPPSASASPTMFIRRWRWPTPR